MRNFTFSIIIPTYNCEDLIKQTLDSIVIQKKTLFECIVMDGLSNDKTLDIVKEYTNKYSNIKYISEKDTGVYDAMNKGIDLAKGKYLYFIGAGDTLYEDSLCNVNNEINDEYFILGRSYHVSMGDFFYMPLKKSDMVYNFINHQAIFYKKDLFEKIGKYDLNYHIFADNILNRKIFGGDDITKKIVNTKIAYYLGNGISENPNLNDEFKGDFEKITVDCFGINYIKELYSKLPDISNKRIIAWGNGGEYRIANKYKRFNIDYFVKSDIDTKELFNNKLVKHREELLKENKENIVVFVYSRRYYNEIRSWLEENGFSEFENFILLTEEVLKILKYIKKI